MHLRRGILVRIIEIKTECGADMQQFCEAVRLKSHSLHAGHV